MAVGARDLIHNPKLLGENIRRLRTTRDATLEQVAEKAGLSKSFLSLVEAGKRKIQTEDLRQIVVTLGYSLCWFLSQTQDSVEDFPLQPEAIVQKKNNSILLAGERTEGKFHMLLLRPMRTKKDHQLIELYLPPQSQMTGENITISAEVRGIVQRGILLVVLKGDEYVVREREEFCYDGNIPHILRNYTKEPAIVTLFLSAPGF
ncbi:MAG TPA: XRE family transcriptional regulator [Patescibacteria group bacterium]|nr:XRE family transcriptional regulator [Patescibacteria group bacterium]